MAVAESKIAQSPVPKDVAERFPDRWVAIREGQVVADADSLEELLKDERVEDTDAPYHVPAPGSYFF